MIHNNKKIGKLGESLAKNFLVSKDYNIIEENYSNRLGEIDIICKKNNVVIFVEVKSRLTDKYGIPCESVTYFKQRQIIKVSLSYIKQHYLYNTNFRYDVIELYLNPNDNKYKLRHLKNAFSYN